MLVSGVGRSEAGRTECTEHRQYIGHTHDRIAVDVADTFRTEAAEARQQDQDVIDRHKAIAVDVFGTIVREDDGQVGRLRVGSV